MNYVVAFLLGIYAMWFVAEGSYARFFKVVFVMMAFAILVVSGK